MKKMIKHTAIFCLIALTSIATSYAQSTKDYPDLSPNTEQPLVFTPEVSIPMKKMMYKALSEKVNAFIEKYGGVGLYLYYAFADLNNDGKNEIFIQFNEEYDFRDSYGNVDTHVFTLQNGKPVEILETQAYAIALSKHSTGGIRNLKIYKQPNTHKIVSYVWNGKGEYIKTNE